MDWFRGSFEKLLEDLFGMKLESSSMSNNISSSAEILKFPISSIVAIL